MESSTSGQVASLITDTEGSSAIMKGAFVTYSNEAKIRQGVSASTIEKYGVYSVETASEMAQVCRAFYDADIGVGITGSFGNPDPNNEDSVLGEVYFAIATKKGTDSFFYKVPQQPSRLSYKLCMADTIVIAAPYWDLSFPAMLKQYIEAINVLGITFEYTPEGFPQGLCKANKLYYVMTAGGSYVPEEFGFGYIKAIAQNFYGIKDVELIKATGLDVVGTDCEVVLNKAICDLN